MRALACADPRSGGTSGIFLAGRFARLGIAVAMRAKALPCSIGDAPVVVALGYAAADYAYVPAPSATVVNPRTGRTCTIQPNGYQWCWTP